MTTFKSVDRMSNLLMKRMAATGTWKYKQRVTDRHNAFRIEERPIGKTMIDGTKVLLLNAAQAPKCSLDRKNVVLNECWSIPDSSLVDYAQSYDGRKDDCEHIQLSGSGDLDGTYLRIVSPKL